jgi:GNAT superfamily N-acetyltransferase
MMALFLADRITVVPENLVTYRFFNSSSLTGKVAETRYCTVEAYRAVLRELVKYPDFTPELQQSFSNKTIGPLLSTMRMQGTVDSYEEMLAYYRDVVFPEFGLSNKEKEFFNSEQDYEDIKRIQECSPIEFLLYQAQSYERRFKMEKGQKICFMAEYFLPDMDALRQRTVGDAGPYKMKLLTQADFADLYLPEWSNALCEQRKPLDVLGVGAYDGDQLVGLAGCSADCDTMWQIGIDVLPEYRRQGIASALTSRLAIEILNRGKVPFYCAAWCNIKSVRNAIKSGFRPAWVEMTAKPCETVDRMNN